MSKEPYEYSIINSNDIDDKLLNQFKSNFYELKDEIIELKLPNEHGSMRLLEDFCSSEKSNKLYGSWIIVNGNFVKPNDFEQIKENCKKFKTNIKIQ